MILHSLLAITSGVLDLTSIFHSSMVLPENVVTPISGTATNSAKITIAIDQAAPLATTASVKGAWSVDLPILPGTLVPKTITITSSASEDTAIVLSDVLVGQVYICSGQSNMELTVSQSLNGTAEAAASAQYGSRLRIFSVLQETPAFFNVTTPQTNLTASIPWSRPSASATLGMSAVCFYHGVNVIKMHPTIAVGLVASSWGGTAIQPWMTPAAIAKCGASTADNDEDDDVASFSSRRVMDFSPKLGPHSTHPTIDSTLWNAMLAPLLPLNPTAFLWYQGESNANKPVQYACLMTSMIAQWRASWPSASTSTPFLLVQLAPWPDHDIGEITGLRYSQTLARDASPNVGMIVAADIGDSSGSNHPIHPPWKQEVGRRSALIGENLVFKNKDIPRTGPLVISATWDAFDPSWKSFHFDSNPNGDFCIAAPKGNGWYCGGIQIKFDRPITLANIQCTAEAFSQGASRGGCGALGSSGGFELWNMVDGNASLPLGTVGPSGETLTSSLCTDCSKCPCMQPAEIWGILPGSGETVVQLNTTWINGGVMPRLRYGWRDYPSMSVFSKADGRPAAPFNVTLTMRA